MLTNGCIPMAYIANPRGSPWVVPSEDWIRSPSTNKEGGSLYVLMRIGARVGQMVWQLKRVASRFIWLNALDASTNIIPSVSFSSKIAFIAWKVPSHPEAKPAHSWRGPTVCCRSGLAYFMSTLPTILLYTSAIPIGLTPGHLSRGIRRHAVYADRCLGLT